LKKRNFCTGWGQFYFSVHPGKVFVRTRMRMGVYRSVYVFNNKRKRILTILFNEKAYNRRKVRPNSMRLQ